VSKGPKLPVSAVTAQAFFGHAVAGVVVRAGLRVAGFRQVVHGLVGFAPGVQHPLAVQVQPGVHHAAVLAFAGHFQRGVEAGRAVRPGGALAVVVMGMVVAAAAGVGFGGLERIVAVHGVSLRAAWRRWCVMMVARVYCGDGPDGRLRCRGRARCRNCA